MGNDGIPLLNAADGNSMEDDDDEDAEEGEGSRNIEVKFIDVHDGSRVDSFDDCIADKVGSSSGGCTSGNNDHDRYNSKHSSTSSSSSEHDKNIEIVNSSEPHVVKSFLLSQIDGSSNEMCPEVNHSAPSSSSLGVNNIQAHDLINVSITHESKKNVSLSTLNTPVNSSALKVFESGDPLIMIKNCEGSELDFQS